MHTAFYRSHKITPPKIFYQLVSGKEIEILNNLNSLETNPRILFYRLVIIKPVHTDIGLLVSFFLPRYRSSRWSGIGGKNVTSPRNPDTPHHRIS